MATTSTLKALYRWDDCDFTWDAAQCGNSWDMFGIYDHVRDDEEPVAVTDRVTNGVSSIHTESIMVADYNKNKIVAWINERVSAAETYWDNIGFIMHVVESIRISDTRNVSMVKGVHDAINVREHVARDITATINESLTIEELVKRMVSYRRTDLEDIGAEDSHISSMKSNINELIGVDDKISLSLRHVAREAFMLVDNLLHRSQVKRTINEAVAASDAYSSHITSDHRETVELVDSFVRACGGVMADIALMKGGMTASQFEELIKHPPGYEPFIPYNVGEYEYQKALVRLLVTAGSMGSEPAVYDAVVNVDIDDTIDRGTVTITDISAATKVYFNKHYYTKPEVNVTLQAGNTADGFITPNIESIGSDSDGFYFTVSLMNAAGTRVAGKITWESVGY